jgi:hypothetical protein
MRRCRRPARHQVWDQNAFNELIRRGQVLLPSDPHHYFRGDNGKLTVGILPVALFCSGHAFFVQRLQEFLQVKPYAVHATFQFSGTPGKRHRFREFQLWDEKYEYFQQLGERRACVYGGGGAAHSGCVQVSGQRCGGRGGREWTAAHGHVGCSHC